METEEEGAVMRWPASETVIISDLDGTLLDRQQQISPENAEAIAAFRKAGGTFVIATGRPWTSALPYARQLELEQPFIAGNGAQLYCPRKSAVLHTSRLSIQPEHSRWLYEQHLQDKGLGLLLYDGEQMLTPSRNDLIVRHERKDNVPSKAVELTKWQEAALSAVKLLAIAATPEMAEVLDYQWSRLRPGSTTVFSESNYLEILPDGCCKGNALQQLVALQGWQHKQLIAVGDQMNDAELLEVATLGIATGNAVAELQDRADAVTISHDRHAIAHIIKERIAAF